MTPRQQVEKVLSSLIETFPSGNDFHIPYMERMVQEESISMEMAMILTHIIENENCVYIVKADGTLKILE